MNMFYDPNVTEHRGIYGLAQKVSIPSNARNASECVSYYLITAPSYHPFWSQYLLMSIRLREVPGLPPPNLMFDGVTHEIMVLAVNPEKGPWTPDGIVKARMSVPYLLPPNVIEQYEATDDEMITMVDLCAQAIVRGALNPDSDGAAAWLTVTTKTLAHIRGEEHAP